jgi:glutamine cyclotransferase
MSECLGNSAVRYTCCLAAILFITARSGAATILYATAAADASDPRGRIFELDYTAGTILNTFNGPTGFDIGDGYTGAAFRQATDELYITDGLGSNRIFRINPDTGAVNSSFPSPTGSSSIDGLEFVGDALYALLVGSAAIAIINPDTGTLINTLPSNTSSLGQGGLTAAGGVLYSRGTANTTIVARNLATGLTFNSFATPNNEAVLGLASDGADLYAASNAGVIYRLNRDTGQVLDSRAYGINFDSLTGTALLVPEPGAVGFVGLLVALACLARHHKRSGEVPRVPG